MELSPSTAVSSIGANFAISTHFVTSLSTLSVSMSEDETKAWRWSTNALIPIVFSLDSSRSSIF